MDALWAVLATAVIVTIGYALTTFVIQPIRNLQKIRDDGLRLLFEFSDVYGVATDQRKYQAREVFRRCASRLEEARFSVPMYWLWGILGLVPKRQRLEEAQAALRRLANLSVQIIDHQPDLTKRQDERAQVAKDATREEEIVKASLRLKAYALIQEP